jgi:hypothetical protein
MSTNDDPDVIDISGKLADMMRTAEADIVYGRQPPKFGIHEDVDFWEYLMWDAFGSGDVRKVGHSPAHLRESWVKGSDANVAMLTGRAIHACVLEHDTEWQRYIRMDDGKDRRSKDYKVLAEEHGADYVLRAKEYDAAVGGRERLMEHTRISRLLNDGSAEVSYAWKDDETGLPLKGRADWLNPGLNTVFDLKTTGDAREHRFGRIARDKGYATQGAHYISGLRALGMDIQHYVIVALEVDPPYEPILYRISSKDMTIAEAHWRALVDMLAHCVKNERWPGYPEYTHVLHMGQYWEAEIQAEVAAINEALDG